MHDAGTMDRFEGTQGLINKILQDHVNMSARLSNINLPGNDRRSVSVCVSHDASQFASALE